LGDAPVFGGWVGPFRCADAGRGGVWLRQEVVRQLQLLHHIEPRLLRLQLVHEAVHQLPGQALLQEERVVVEMRDHVVVLFEPRQEEVRPQVHPHQLFVLQLHDRLQLLVIPEVLRFEQVRVQDVELFGRVLGLLFVVQEMRPQVRSVDVQLL